MLNKLIITLGSIVVGFACISCINIHNNVASTEEVKPTEQAYITNKDNKLSADTLPYYKNETEEKETISVKIESNNSLIHELKN